ncbi:MAG: hypothetical protein ACRDJY_09870 [Thermoleophilaceae bacterium]
MPDRLEQMLSEIAREVEFPPTPDLTPVDRVPSRPIRYGPPVRRVLVLTALTLLVAAATVFAASPGARDAVLDLFGIDGASVERVPTLPDAPPPAMSPAGERVSLAEAQRQAAFEILVPRPPPKHVHLSGRAPGGVVSFTTRGVTVTELRASIEREFLRKLATEGTRIERLRVAGHNALWLVGRPHIVFLLDAEGRVLEESLRKAGNVLLFERGGAVVRIEGADSLAAAIAVARSLG